ncbi:MAG: hypothetical protein PHX51_07595 [Clostridia bacterium]|nr:hypothetical protein [Clostridia bacterium]
MKLKKKVWIPIVAVLAVAVIVLLWMFIASRTIKITTVDDLMNVNDNLDRHYSLEADLDLGGMEWTPIGNREEAFSGIFDGNGHTIGNFKITGTQVFAGLFGYSTGTIADLTVNKGTIETVGDTDDMYGGLFVALSGNGSNYSNINVSGSVSVTNNGGEAYAAIFAGFSNYGNISDIDAEGKVAALGNDSAYAGGIYGAVFHGMNDNIDYEGDVTATSLVGAVYAGGFAGKTAAESILGIGIEKSHVSNAKIVATINGVQKSSTDSKVYIGGMVGYNNWTHLSNCTVEFRITTVQTNSPVYVGGCVGCDRKSTFTNVSVVGNIELEGLAEEDVKDNVANYQYDIHVGGFLGRADYSEATACSQKGNIEIDVALGQVYSGGFVGMTNSAKYDDCDVDGIFSISNASTETSKDKFDYIQCGGFGGLINNGSAVTNSTINANLILNSTCVQVYAGGLAGATDYTNYENNVVKGDITVAKTTGTEIVVVGGFIGEEQDNTKGAASTLNCNSYTGNINVDSNAVVYVAGGVASSGFSTSDTNGMTMSNTFVDALITSVGSRVYSAGVLAYSNHSTLKNIVANVDVVTRCSKGIYSGGIVGYMRNTEVNGAFYIGKNAGITLNTEDGADAFVDYMGGIAGHGDAGCEVVGCLSMGEVHGVMSVGAVVGSRYEGTTENVFYGAAANIAGMGTYATSDLMVGDDASAWFIEGMKLDSEEWDFIDGKYPSIIGLKYTLNVQTSNYSEGTIGNPYQVTSLYDLGYNVASKLINDIDMSGVDWTPIGTQTAPFNGSLDCDNHTLSNFSYTGDTLAGLFGYFSGEIRNLNIDGFDVEVAGGYAGAIAAESYGSINNVNAKNVDVRGKGNIGALVGYNSGYIIDSEVSGSVYCEGEATMDGTKICSAGGLAGEANDLNVSGVVVDVQVLIENAFKVKDGIGTTAIGGLAGLAVKVNVKDSVVNGKLQYAVASDSTCYIGGFVGYTNSIYIEESAFLGGFEANIKTAMKAVYAGGLAGQSATFTEIQNSYVNTDIEVMYNDSVSRTAYVGGAIGQTSEIIVDGFYYAGNILAESNTSALYVAGITNSGNGSIANSFVLGTINLSDSIAFSIAQGGALTSAQFAGDVTNSYYTDVSNLTGLGVLVTADKLKSGSWYEFLDSNIWNCADSDLPVLKSLKIASKAVEYEYALGSIGNPIELDADDLSGIQMYKAYKITENIDFGGKVWTSIGTASAPFVGYINGNRNTIRNFVIEDTSATGTAVGMFGYLAGSVVNLNIENASISTTKQNSGIIAGILYGNLENVNITGVEILAAGKNAGLIAGTFEGTVLNVTINGSIGAGESVGALAGIVSGGNVTGLNANVDITLATSKTASFGAVASEIANTSFSKCSVTGSLNIDATEASLNVGGFFGKASSSVFTNCSTAVKINIDLTRNEGMTFESLLGDMKIDADAAKKMTSIELKLAGFSGVQSNTTLYNIYSASEIVLDVVTTEEGQIDFVEEDYELIYDKASVINTGNTINTGYHFGKITRELKIQTGGIVATDINGAIQYTLSATDVTITFDGYELTEDDSLISKNRVYKINVLPEAIQAAIDKNIADGKEDELEHKAYIHLIDSVSVNAAKTAASIGGMYFALFEYEGQTISVPYILEEGTEVKATDYKATSVTLTQLNTSSFYTSSMKWSDTVWDFTDLDFEADKFPHLIID